ncbi:MAG: hypothetical protein COA78_15490 [Blastopirellula sp.]|nr:MAG: hypothetical protein COA78_15490 [Blastopirellula sp.]
MSDRNDAIAVLKEAREILIERLSERIVENKEEILDDASGESYLSEIDTIYEQIAGRLIQVNQMISNLPADQQALFESQSHLEVDPATASSLEVVSIDTAAELDPATEVLLSGDHGSSVVLEAPHPEPVMPPKAAAFRLFMQQIEQGKITEAGNTLAPMFDLEEPRAQECARYFAEQLQQGPEVIAKAMNIRIQLTMGNFNDALMLLHESFGVQGLEAITVLQSLKGMLT